jgi:hypothetical protein
MPGRRAESLIAPQNDPACAKQGTLLKGKAALICFTIELYTTKCPTIAQAPPVRAR